MVVPFLHVTTRIAGRKDDGLLGKVGGQGFPHLVAMDAEGKTLGSPPGRNVSDFRLMMEYFELKPKAATGDAKTKIEFFIRAIAMGDYETMEAAKKHLATLGAVSKDQQTRIDEQMLNLEVNEIAKPVHENRDRSQDLALRAVAGEKFVEMHKKGRVPKPDHLFGEFYSDIMAHAELSKNIPLFEEAMNLLEERFPKATGFFEQKRKVLEKLKEEKEAPKTEKEAPKDPK